MKGEMLADLVLLGFMTIVDLVAISTLPGIWRGQGLVGLERRVRSTWFWGESALQGYLRAFPIGIITLTSLVVAGGGTFAENVYGRSDVGRLGAMVSEIAFIGTLVGMLLAVSVMLFNFPKQIVPPALRDQQGLVIERLRRYFEE